MKILRYVGVIAFLLGGLCQTAFAQFDNASVIFETNATDGDFEVVFKMKGDDEGIETLLVLGPNSRVMINSSTVGGIREYVFESPEPSDIAEITSAYPEGEYLFFATTPSGSFFSAEAVLSHTLPATTEFMTPAAEATGVARDVTLTWAAVPGISSYIVGIGNDDLEESFEVVLQGSVTSLQVPGGFLMANTEYEFEIGTVGANGNVSFIETAFTTGN